MKQVTTYGELKRAYETWDAANLGIKEYYKVLNVLEMYNSSVEDFEDEIFETELKWMFGEE